jgi:hypothetical protein
VIATGGRRKRFYGFWFLGWARRRKRCGKDGGSRGDHEDGKQVVNQARTSFSFSRKSEAMAEIVDASCISVALRLRLSNSSVQVGSPCATGQCQWYFLRLARVETTALLVRFDGYVQVALDATLSLSLCGCLLDVIHTSQVNSDGGSPAVAGIPSTGE